MSGGLTIWQRPLRALSPLLVRPHHDVRVAIWVWGALAVACLLGGILQANNLGRSDAYFEVRSWLSLWYGGADVYGIQRLRVDYPPNALVFMSPLLLFPQANGETWFAIFNALACLVTAWTIVSLTSGYAAVPLSRTERLAYALMLLVWSPTRVGIWNGQTSPTLILCCCLAVRMAEWQPLLAGVLLAIGLSKPHIAFGFIMLVVFCRMWKMLATALVTTVAAVIAYTVSVGRATSQVLREYLTNLVDVYGGPTFLRAEVDIRPFFTDLIPNYEIGEALYLLTSTVLALYLVRLTWHGRNNPDAGVWVMAASMMWAIAVFPFRRYGLILIAPTVLLMLWQSRVGGRRLALVGVMIFLIAADLPFLIRHALVTYGPSLVVKYASLTHYINRCVTVVCLISAFRSLASIPRQRQRSALAASARGQFSAPASA